MEQRRVSGVDGRRAVGRPRCSALSPSAEQPQFGGGDAVQLAPWSPCRGYAWRLLCARSLREEGGEGGSARRGLWLQTPTGGTKGRHAILHDFCMCVPFGIVTALAGLGVSVLRHNLGLWLLGGGVATLFLTSTSLRVWRQGSKSQAYTAGCLGKRLATSIHFTSVTEHNVVAATVLLHLQGHR